MGRSGHDVDRTNRFGNSKVDVVKIRECLALLREADEILMTENELSLAVHLSLVIERLAERLPN